MRNLYLRLPNPGGPPGLFPILGFFARDFLSGIAPQIIFYPGEPPRLFFIRDSLLDYFLSGIASRIIFYIRDFLLLVATRPIRTRGILSFIAFRYLLPLLVKEMSPPESFNMGNLRQLVARREGLEQARP